MKANNIKLIVIIDSPIAGSPKTKAFDVNTAPLSPLCQAPLITITIAVSEHIIIVSKKKK